MKQRITVGQIMELTEEQKQRLRGWWKPEPDDTFYSFDFNKIYHGQYNEPWMDGTQPECLPLLSIGQMIELLEELDVEYLYYLLEDYRQKMVEDEGIELADELWGAVKEVL